jgi:hypothetical protein
MEAPPNAITPSLYLNYSQINNLLSNMASHLQSVLNNKELESNQNPLWRVTSNQTVPDQWANFYLNMFYNGNPVGHVSIHMGTSHSGAGSTHLKYHHSNTTNQILLNGRNFYFKNPSIHSFLESCVIETLNTYGNQIFNSLNLQKKYLKYKNKYLKLKLSLQ